MINHVLNAELSRPELLHELFEHSSRAWPDRVALVCGHQQMTYGELERRANRLAHFLRARGIGRGALVGLLLPRSMEVYVALLGILKSGAAYVPLDPDYPDERIAHILADCGAIALVTKAGLAHKAAAFRGSVLRLDDQQAELESRSDAPITRDETDASWEDLCYVIYTSGSTGRPKGVEIEHRSACHLVRAEGKLFQVRPEDRVYQGFSIAFDASVEEVWLAFFAGATLVIGTEEMMHAGADLSRQLTEAGVTVLSCVPTLLSMMDEDVPTVRLLIFGGEQCPPDLVKRWSKPGRRIVNTYGPTEATVIATSAECDPQKPVTIGRALPNYFVCILDETLRPVPAGAAGELCIGGVGLARGYVGRPELTAEKFVPNPLAKEGRSPARLYKTGDLARCNADGEIEFLGRIDTQVKIRGFRVELSEIEAVLLESPGVLAAAVTLREDPPQLVGYLVPRDSTTLDEEAIRSALRQRLPAYMVPALLEMIPALPTLPSGKVDRKNLPAPRARPTGAKQNTTPPRTPLEKKITTAWEKLFAPQTVSVRDDFFLDLGGHSLLAARMVSELRRDAPLQALSMLDVYEHPTIEMLAAKFEQTEAAATHESDARTFRQPSSWSHFLCGAMQGGSLYFVLGFFALQWLAPYLTYTWLIEDEYDYAPAILGALAVLIGLYPFMLLTAIVVKWVVIGRYRPGAHPLWGLYYFRWWLVNTIESGIPVGYLSGTPLLNIYYRLMGARIGRNVHLGTDGFATYDLLSIGDDSSIGGDASLLGFTVEDGMLKIGRIDIGERCFVGTGSVLREETVMENDAALEDLSCLRRGGKIPRGERWLGSPAQRVSKAPEEIPAQGKSKRPSQLRSFAFGILHGIGLLIFPVLVIAAIFPGMVLMNELNYADDYYWYLLIAPVVALIFVVLLCLEIAAIKWLLLGRVKAGRYPLHSFFYLRKWFVDQTMELSLDVVGPLYASLYLAPWYRLLGAKLGRRAEVSTASFISPDLLSLDDESFIADSASLGAARVEHDHMTIAENRIGKRSFIGNSAMLPPGAIIGDNCLIGCLSVPPANPADAAREGTAWLGSPAIFLPQRQRSAGFAEESTFHPSRKLWLQRAAIEFVRVILPATGFIVLTSLLLSVVVLIAEDIEAWQMLLLFPLLYTACGAVAVLFTVAMKWLLVGRYRPCEKPLWCAFVWRNELVNALQEHFSNLFLVSLLTGTPFVCWFFRLLGAKIGRRVYMETTDLTEYDLIRIGDDAALNADSTMQTHLFEDRVMKMSTIDIGARCNVGALSLVLYDTKMEDGAALGDLSLLMKGEVLPAGTRWEGVPARREK